MPDVPDRDVTLWELARNLDKMESRIDGRFVEVHRRLDSLAFVPRDVYTIEIGALRERVDAIEERSRWLVRTLAAAFLLPLVVGIIIALAVAR